jgi:cell division septation protein DedD
VKRLALVTTAFFLMVTAAPVASAQGADRSAKAIVDRAVAESASGDKTIRSIIVEVEAAARVAEGADQRSLYAFLGTMNEQMGNYVDASQAYARAASISAGNATGMPRYTAEQLVINAVRCALSSGDYVTADNYLSSRVKSSQDPVILSWVKLYGVWSRLSQAETGAALAEPMALLKSYASESSMEGVRPAVLLSIWYIDSDRESAELLVSQYPDSPESAIVQGNAALLPAPFWYFSPRNTLASVPVAPESAPQGDIEPAILPAAAGTASPPPAPPRTPAATPPLPPPPMRPVEPPPPVSPGVHQQLGLFRNAANAQRLADSVKARGFFPEVRTTSRGGETYYVVVVAENAGRTMGAQLKAAGFECYPVTE